MAETPRRKRRFGSVRQLPSGRWQVRYHHPETNERITDTRTYPTKRDAEVALSAIEADLTRGAWVDPDAGQVSFGAFADAWLRDRDLADRTRERYEGVIRMHIQPTFGRGPWQQSARLGSGRGVLGCSPRAWVRQRWPRRTACSGPS